MTGPASADDDADASFGGGDGSGSTRLTTLGRGAATGGGGGPAQPATRKVSAVAKSVSRRAWLTLQCDPSRAQRQLKSGTTKSLPVHGADSPKTLWSVAPLGTCFVGFESGSTVDGSQLNLWRCKKDGDGIVWERSDLDTDAYALGGGTELRGASTADGSRAFFVGATTWATAALTK